MIGILGFTRHLLGAVVKGFFFTGLVAAALCLAALYITAPGHVLRMDVTAAFAIVLAVLAGVLGALVALVYHLAHLDGIHAMVRHYSETRAAGRRPGGAR